MEKQPSPEKSASFSNHSNKLDTVDLKSDGSRQNAEAPSSSSSDGAGLSQILQETDRFIETYGESSSSNSVPEVPSYVESLTKMVECMATKYETKSSYFGQNQEQDSSFIEAIRRISKLHWIDRATSVLHRVMTLLEDELRSLLRQETSSSSSSLKQNTTSDPKTPKSPKPSPRMDESVRGSQNNNGDGDEEEEILFPAIAPDTIANMNKISTLMISSGYDTECCLIYSFSRRDAFNDVLHVLGFDTISVDEVHRMQWESLEGQIATWNNVVKHCATNFFSGERKLCDAVFSDYPQISLRLFRDLAYAVVLRFLNFAEAVVLTKRSSEKLFKFLDMYETLRDLIPTVDFDNSSGDLQFEISLAKLRLAEAAASIFNELENSIKRDNSRTPVPSGAVHPLTRYTMNYLKYACEYKDTMEQVFQETERAGKRSSELGLDNERKPDDQMPKTSAFSVQLMLVMDLLDANLEMKSKLYRDPALRYIFLMNNGRYILQKIKGSTEIREMMGPNWLRKKSADLRQCHKNYQRETWSRLLQCLSHEGLQVSAGKVMKPALKERFKSFNQMFDEIHKTQSTWVVSDEQLQSELRASISAVVIPAYRSFLGRFKQYIDPGKQSEKYIKYQPEDIEASIEEFFDGNPTSMARRRT